VTAGIASTLRALRRRRSPRLSAALTTALAGAYATVARPLMLHWGATCDELREPLPGDELVPDPLIQSTRAVTVDAAVEAVWPWLAQIGQDRAGFYSYEWLENLAGCEMRNSDELHPEWQTRAVGETVYLHPLQGMPVERFEPGRVLVLDGWGAFVVKPLGANRSRVIIRGRTPKAPAAILNELLIEIPHFVMERKMLLGLKQRAERPHAATNALPAA
jgi:hypothetical protein